MSIFVPDSLSGERTKASLLLGNTASPNHADRQFCKMASTTLGRVEDGHNAGRIEICPRRPHLSLMGVAERSFLRDAPFQIRTVVDGGSNTVF